MTEVNTNHFEVVNKGLTGKGGDDEQTFASLAMLAERLERLKSLSSAFSNIEFSPEVMSLKGHESTVLIV